MHTCKAGMSENGNIRNPSALHIDISFLPDDVMYAVFRLFDALELMPFARVCQRWRCLIDDPRLRKVFDIKAKYHAKLMADNGLIMARILSNSRLLHTFNAHGLQLANRVIPTLAEYCPHLSVLELSFCRDISLESWQIIGTAPWPRLTHLCLKMSMVNNHVLATILPTLRTLTVLDITANQNVTDDGILCIAGHTPVLRCLLSAINNRTSVSIVPLLDAVGLHITQLSLSGVDCTILATLPSACVCLRVLALQNTDSPIDTVAECLLKLTNLTHLCLHNIEDDTLDEPFDIARANTYDKDCLSRLEYLKWNNDPFYDDYLLEYIARRCGNCLRYLYIMERNTTPNVLTEVFSLCTSLKHLELDLSFSQPISPTFAAELVSTMPRLRVFAIQTEIVSMNSIIDHLVPILPNTVVCSIHDLYNRAEYERWRQPDIQFQELRPDIHR